MSGGVAFKFFRLIFSLLGEPNQELRSDDVGDLDSDTDADVEPDEEEDVLMSVDAISSEGEVQSDDLLLIFARTRGGTEQLLVSPYSRGYTPNGIGQLYDKLKRKGRQHDVRPEDKQTFEEAASRILAPYIEGEDNAWFNSHIINRWFDHLSEQYNNVKGKKIANIHSDWQDNYIKDLTPEGPRQNDRNRLREANTILWPIANGGHWYLLEISINGNNVDLRCLDGFNKIENHRRFLDRGQKLIEALYGKNHGFHIKRKSLQIPQQHNTDDCGPVICFQAERICNGYDPFTTHCVKSCDYSQVRPKVAQVLACLPTHVFVQGYILQGQMQRGKHKRTSREPHEVIDLTKEEASAAARPHKKRCTYHS